MVDRFKICVNENFKAMKDFAVCIHKQKVESFEGSLRKGKAILYDEINSKKNMQ